MDEKNLNENLEDSTEDMANLEDATDENVESNNEASEEVDYKELLDKKEAECKDYLDRLQRTTAEYDNFRKRTIKEKEELYDRGVTDSIEKVLPILDNLERALECSSEDGPLKEGLEMTLKMFKGILEKEGIVEIPSVGEQFDPNYHNAVMHVQDEQFGNNEVIEVLQKGYKLKDKIIRFSMVKVAN
ncbi:MAG: nucleotide exchange factor GrpE [Clostridium sp.]|uniref:nucleotide exchange factor GrpE n=1 Tax=Clostridium sp. TaxID=1506 RepID=UPI002FC6CA6A